MAKVTWRGLNELYIKLHSMPNDLGTQGAVLAFGSARNAAAAIRAAYPVRTGKMAGGVKVRETVRKYGGRAVVTNRVKYAWYFEHGATDRQTKRGWKRGSTVPRPTFIPIRERYDRVLEQALTALLLRHGLQVVQRGAG